MNSGEPKKPGKRRQRSQRINDLRNWAQTRVCGGCGMVNQETIPEEVRAHVFEPRFTARVAQLSGAHGISKRAAEEIVRGIFGVPNALGTICNLQREVSAAITPGHAKAV